jgi:hypothetical protein
MLHLSSLERCVDAYELDVWTFFVALIGISFWLFNYMTGLFYLAIDRALPCSGLSATDS